MILGIESSCDESALALLDPEFGIRGEWVASSLAKHQAFGGIVPDIASREHLHHFPNLLKEVLKEWEPTQEDRLAVTVGPGLAGCLAQGMALAHALALAYKLPVTGVNHLRGHAFSPFIGLHAADPDAFSERLESHLPHLGLIVSGGNTVLFRLDRERTVTVLAETLDDAAGEALDKGAKLLGMPYPGGPLIEQAARGGDPAAITFPRAFPGAQEHRFSFSGLKTSLRYHLEKVEEAAFEQELPDICASYQEAVVDALARKVGQFLESGGYASLGLSGGVACNTALRDRFASLGSRYGLPVFIAERRHTGDNAAMIAFAAFIDPAGCVHPATAFQPSLPLNAKGA
jgi:N6-L-threonylcarbamoyladenine synthase